MMLQQFYDRLYEAMNSSSQEDRLAALTMAVEALAAYAAKVDAYAVSLNRRIDELETKAVNQ